MQHDTLLYRQQQSIWIGFLDAINIVCHEVYHCQCSHHVTISSVRCSDVGWWEAQARLLTAGHILGWAGTGQATWAAGSTTHLLPSSSFSCTHRGYNALQLRGSSHEPKSKLGICLPSTNGSLHQCGKYEQLWKVLHCYICLSVTCDTALLSPA